MLNNNRIVFFLLLSVSFDIILYTIDFNYRFIYYETLLLVASRFNIAFFLSFIIVNSLKVAQVFFSVNIFTFFGNDLLVLILIGVWLAISFFCYINKVYFLSLFLIILFVDKKIAMDKVSTSLFYTSYFSSVQNLAYFRKDPVYDAAKDLILSGPTIFLNWESLGVPLNASVIEKILKRYPRLSYKAIYRDASTIDSEFNYLCSVNVGVFQSDSVCLPNLVKFSSAFHGNNSFIYNRTDFYRNAGFDLIKFRKDFPSYPDECFYSFKGLCDKNLFTEVFDLAGKKTYDLIYALTLDSHFPYFKYENHVEDLYSEVDDVMREYFENHSSYNLLIVGDHPPPGFTPKFDSTHVPLFMVKVGKSARNNGGGFNRSPQQHF